MTYLVIGVDRSTLAGWHRNLRAEDALSAMRHAVEHARLRGIDLVVAAVIGPGANVVALPLAQAPVKAA
jgi:hypothetical protein